MRVLDPPTHLSFQEQRYQLIAGVRATVELVPGDWTFMDGETPWSLEVARARGSDLCVDGVNFTTDGSERYLLDLLGPATASIEASVATVRDAWQKKGWFVQTIVPPSTGYYEIGADTPDGISLSFGATAEGVNESGFTTCFAAEDK